MQSKIAVIAAMPILLSFGGCMTAQQHAADVAAAGNDHITVGTVQREIRVGMSGADVIAVLGAPNVVTTDEQRRESWVYDKISTESAYSGSSGGIGILFLGGVRQSASATSTSQRTLTIVIKFDEAKQVRDFAYRASSF